MVEEGSTRKLDLLLVDDDEELREDMARYFSRQDYVVSESGDGLSALTFAAEREFDAIVLDMSMPGMSGLEVLKQLRERGCEAQVIMLTGRGSIETAVEAVKLGACEFLTKPIALRELDRLVRKSLDAGRLRKENELLKAVIAKHKSRTEIVGQSPAMQEVFRLIQRTARSDNPILIEGESGTGKELVAEAVHAASLRSKGPLVVFDCSVVAPNLIESELFGHERGAFTGAEAQRAGVLEEAAGGTIFLDEIGELPLELQPKLLRVLESRTIRPVGGTRTIPLDVRFIAATHRDLAREVNRGTFREDLYYRLAVVRIRVPPLRERIEDIPRLVKALLERQLSHQPELAERWLENVDDAHWARLATHPWRGNVRELRNMVERAVALSPAHALELEPSSLGITDSVPVAPAGAEVPVDFEQGFREQKRALLESFERRYLTGILERHDGNISRAAAAAGLDRMYFKRLLSRYR